MRFNSFCCFSQLMPKSMPKKILKLMEIFIFFFSTIYIVGAPGGTPRKTNSPKMAPEATKWSNLNLQTLFGACLCVKTPRFGIGKFVLMIAPPPLNLIGLMYTVIHFNSLNIKCSNAICHLNSLLIHIKTCTK